MQVAVYAGVAYFLVSSSGYPIRIGVYTSYLYKAPCLYKLFDPYTFFHIKMTLKKSSAMSSHVYIPVTKRICITTKGNGLRWSQRLKEKKFKKLQERFAL